MYIIGGFFNRFFSSSFILLFLKILKTKLILPHKCSETHCSEPVRGPQRHSTQKHRQWNPTVPQKWPRNTSDKSEGSLESPYRLSDSNQSSRPDSWQLSRFLPAGSSDKEDLESGVHAPQKSGFIRSGCYMSHEIHKTSAGQMGAQRGWVLAVVRAFSASVTSASANWKQIEESWADRTTKPLL